MKQIQLRLVGDPADLEAFLIALGLIEPGRWQLGPISTRESRFTKGHLVARSTLVRIDEDGE